jgi:CHAD domain-containing protein
MAKAREIPGLSGDLAYGEVAARVIAIRWQEVIDHSAGVLDVTDIERVHDMRVATRRLRAALEIFMPCLPAKRGKAVLKEVKQLADALGQRRDADVAIEVLTSIATAMPHPDRRGVESLVDDFREEQLGANDGLAEPVDPVRLRRLEAAVAELEAAAREAAAGASRRDGVVD